MYDVCTNIGRRKRNDSDEDIEQVLAELALEYSGEKPKDKKIENKPCSPPNEQNIDDDDKKKKTKKDKKKEKVENNDSKDEIAHNKETIVPELNNTDEVEVSTVKTAAQKKKEKKEREKQKKLAQKKAVNKRFNLVVILINKLYTIYSLCRMSCQNFLCSNRYPLLLTSFNFYGNRKLLKRVIRKLMKAKKQRSLRRRKMIKLLLKKNRIAWPMLLKPKKVRRRRRRKVSRKKDLKKQLIKVISLTNRCII